MKFPFSIRSLHTSHDIRRRAVVQVTMTSRNAHSSDMVSSDIVSCGNDIKDKHRSEAHSALRESRSVDRVWNSALEELGRMNINFDPAWMSGKNIGCTVPSFSNNWLRLTVSICVPEYNKVYFDPLPFKRQESSENRSCDF